MLATAPPATFDPHPNLQDLIASHAARRSSRPSAAVTPKGEAVATVYRLRKLLAALPATERAEVVGLAAVELASLAGDPEQDAEGLVLCLTSAGELFTAHDVDCLAGLEAI